MESVYFVGAILWIVVGGAIVCSLLFPTAGRDETNVILPFSVVSVPNSSPSTRAFLERLAGQAAWMDSSLMHCLILVYRDGETETAALCEELCRQYDFLMMLELSAFEELMRQKLDLQ